jgi:hypothetical protein
VRQLVLPKFRDAISEALKRALIKAWKEIPLETLRKVNDDFPKRLNACIEAQEGFFE